MTKPDHLHQIQSPRRALPRLVAWRLMITLLALLPLCVALGNHDPATRLQEGCQRPKSRILVYPFGHCLNSHLLNADRLSRIVADSGHSVDLLVSSSYRYFDNHHSPDDLSQPRHAAGETKRKGEVKLVEFQTPTNYVPVCDYDTLDFMLYASLQQRFGAFFETSVRYCDAILSDRKLLATLKATKYDLVIVESMDPCSRILVDYLDVPFILLVTTGLGHFDSNPRPPSYLPAAIAPFTSQMDLGQRILNTLMKLMYDRAIPAIIGILNPFEELKIKHGINTTISLTDSFDRTSLKLVNSDFAVEYPAPIEPDTVMVGGFAVESPSPLPDDLQAFLDGAGEDGVIVMSFGTLVKRFDPMWTQLFADVFARLPSRVVWRHSGPIGENYTVSPNIRLLRWLPQVSILAHPKTKLVISHCGLNSLFEAVRYSVPVLAIPLSGDQLNNAAKVTGHLRMGLTVDIHSMTRESLYRDIRSILGNPQFAENACEVSRRMDDQPLSAADKIRFWVDYVIRHDGAPHLRSGASLLPWYQYLCIDVLFCLLGIVLLSLFLVAIVVWRVLKIVCRLSLFFSEKFPPG